MKRPIASVETRYNPGAHKSRYVGGRNKITFGECGHVEHRKISAGIPRGMRSTCRQCTELETNGGYRERTGNGPLYAIGWDAETRLPTKVQLDGGAPAKGRAWRDKPI